MRFNVGDLGKYTPQAMLDKGTYVVQIVKLAEEQTASGSSVLVVTLQVVEGPTQTNGTSPVGRTLFHRLPIPSFHHKDQGQMAGARLRAFCEAFGIPWDPQGFDDADAIGRTAKAYVGVREYNGIEYEDIKRFQPL